MTIQSGAIFLFPLVQGFMLSASLIIAIGPQNLFLLRQGLHRRYLFAVAAISTLADLCLISLGVGGLGAAIASNERLLLIMTVAGAAFLAGIGIRSFYTAWHDQKGVQVRIGTALNPGTNLSLKRTALAAVSFSILNPSAYVDTLLMIGTTSGRYPLDERFLFATGAVLASGLWFFSLTFGASRLTPFFRHSSAWRTLDVVSGCSMLAIAGGMLIVR